MIKDPKLRKISNRYYYYKNRDLLNEKSRIYRDDPITRKFLKKRALKIYHSNKDSINEKRRLRTKLENNSKEFFENFTDIDFKGLIRIYVNKLYK